ncbi:hypothetical protein H0H87_001327 [Tephrocybe sp. NHM501043]|nr:hypothetical protein H0H87_001327 [Tephrocybe sp. NHM501043]
MITPSRGQGVDGFIVVNELETELTRLSQKRGVNGTVQFQAYTLLLAASGLEEYALVQAQSTIHHDLESLLLVFIYTLMRQAIDQHPKEADLKKLFNEVSLSTDIRDLA